MSYLEFRCDLFADFLYSVLTLVIRVSRQQHECVSECVCADRCYFMDCERNDGGCPSSPRIYRHAYSMGCESHVLELVTLNMPPLMRRYRVDSF
jgi:hypothetical protein